MKAKLQSLWTLEIETPRQWESCGVILFHLRRVFGDFYEEGRIFGGDRDHGIMGSYRIENLLLDADLRVQRYAPTSGYPLGNDAAIDLTLSTSLEGQLERDVVRLDGRVGHDAPARFRLIRRADLV